MKPKLFLCAGMSKSGTTTLWKLLNNYNLINNMRYKETHYLKMLCDMRDGNTDDIYPQDIKDSWKNYLVTRNREDSGLDIPYSFKDYKWYLDNNLKDKSQAVADFSQSISILPEYFLEEIRDNLCDDFDVKIIILFREPVRRLWSHCVNLSYEVNGWYNKTKPPQELFYEYMNLPQFQNLYVNVKDKFEKIFDNVIFLSTEKFYTSQTEHDRLSDFLGISKLEKSDGSQLKCGYNSITLANLYENKTLYGDNVLSSEVIEVATKKLLPSTKIYEQL
jgi:hypothetical protein